MKGYNRLNHLKRCRIIVDIVNAHYREGLTTYSGIFRQFVYPFYPMSYKSFMKIVNMPNIDLQIKQIIKESIAESIDEAEKITTNQLNLFE